MQIGHHSSFLFRPFNIDPIFTIRFQQSFPPCLGFLYSECVLLGFFWLFFLGGGGVFFLFFRFQTPEVWKYQVLLQGRQRHAVNSNDIKDSQKAQCQAENKHSMPILLKDELLVPKYNKQRSKNKFLAKFFFFPKDSVSLLSERWAFGEWGKKEIILTLISTQCGCKNETVRDKSHFVKRTILFIGFIELPW